MTNWLILILSCSEQNLDFSFSNNSEDFGLFEPPRFPGDLQYQGDTFLHETQAFHMFAGSGVLVADFNGDDWLDIFIPTAKDDELYLGGANRSFQSAHQWITYESCLSVGGAVADYDGDGDLDIYLAVTQGQDLLLRNDGDQFTDVTLDSHINLIRSDSTAVSWADIDLDGDLDLAVSGHKDVPQGSTNESIPVGDPNMVYKNMGNGKFQPIELPILDRESRTLAITWIQHTPGERPYLYIVNDSMGAPLDQPTPNVLYGWENDRLIIMPEDSGLEVSMSGMGFAMADINHDHLPDLLITNEGPPSLFVSIDEESWYDDALSKGLGELQEDQYFSWGASIIDFDNDTDLDIWLGYGPALNYAEEKFLPEPDAFLLNTDSVFIDATSYWNLVDYQNTRGGLFVDLNKDGALDLVRSSIQEPVSIFYGTEKTNNWITISLNQEGMNRHGIGSLVELTIDEQQYTQWVTSGTSLASGNPPLLHFGLGKAENIDTIQVYWPTGESTSISDVDINQHLNITR